jgi:hypothetical protein
VVIEKPTIVTNNLRVVETFDTLVTDSLLLTGNMVFRDNGAVLIYRNVVTFDDIRCVDNIDPICRNQSTIPLRRNYLLRPVGSSHTARASARGTVASSGKMHGQHPHKASFVLTESCNAGGILSGIEPFIPRWQRLSFRPR